MNVWQPFRFAATRSHGAIINYASVIKQLGVSYAKLYRRSNVVWVNSA